MSANSPDYQAFMERIFLGYLLEQGASEKTRRNYRTDVRHFFGWMEASRVHSLVAVNHETLEAYKRSHTDAHVPISTLNRRLSALRMFFRCAMKEGWITENPMDAVPNITDKVASITHHSVSHAVRLPINLQEDLLSAPEPTPPLHSEPVQTAQSIHPIFLALLWVGALASLVYLTAKITEYVYAQNQPAAPTVSLAPARQDNPSFSQAASFSTLPARINEPYREPEVEIVNAAPIIMNYQPATLPLTLTTTDDILHILGASISGQAPTSLIMGKDTMFAGSLGVVGDTLLSRTTIAGSLLVDGLVTIGPDGVETVGSPLFIQKNRLASLNLMNGALIIDTNGNIQVSGNVNALGDLTVNGEIHASTISGSFRKLLITNPPISSESGHYVSHATTGTSAIVSDLTQAFIATAEVTEHSLIYITPLSSTNNEVLYIQKIYPGQGFTVAIDEVVDEDIRFNWWLIN